MSLLGWLFGTSNFIRFDDSFALRRELLWESVCQAVESETESGRFVLLVAHFTETFSQLQEQLERSAVNYQVVTGAIDERWLSRLPDEPYDRVFLVLASSLPRLNDEEFYSRQASVQRSKLPLELSCMVCECHPLPSHDDAIERFSKWAPLKVRLGYFMAMDDAVVSRAVGKTTIEVLEQLGLGRREPLVASSVVSRRLRVVLRRNAAQARADVSADSAAQWFELNVD